MFRRSKRNAARDAGCTTDSPSTPVDGTSVWQKIIAITGVGRLAVGVTRLWHEVRKDEDPGA